ncbi:acyloxyacyl hydrolase [Variovorax sp. J22R24]|uniref:acyloxyacyl hydrolase n=1 Tax=Variovorax gracilis TaxID=3053502 RepID=UPI002574FB84|nr:acyloxyacyl hydrolase [Variovorax sp. J22R24]MDM0107490.1 acyloxyacyl hydrolase [Variovorax sp. J22R24]
MSNSSSCFKAVLCTGCLLLSGVAAAHRADQAVGIYLEGGQAPHTEGDTNAFTIGVVVPWSHREPPAPPGALSFYWDIFLSNWSAPVPSGRERGSYTQAGVIANWRWRFSQGESPWFVEAGVGGTVMDSIYRTASREFSTAFQFTEQIGFGRNFGAQGEHELSFRFQHFSNAGIKEPNPGENFWRVRYLYRF